MTGSSSRPPTPSGTSGDQYRVLPTQPLCCRWSPPGHVEHRLSPDRLDRKSVAPSFRHANSSGARVGPRTVTVGVRFGGQSIARSARTSSRGRRTTRQQNVGLLRMTLTSYWRRRALAGTPVLPRSPMQSVTTRTPGPRSDARSGRRPAARHLRPRDSRPGGLAAKDSSDVDLTGREVVRLVHQATGAAPSPGDHSVLGGPKADGPYEVVPQVDEQCAIDTREDVIGNALTQDQLVDPGLGASGREARRRGAWCTHRGLRPMRSSSPSRQPFSGLAVSIHQVAPAAT